MAGEPKEGAGLVTGGAGHGCVSIGGPWRAGAPGVSPFVEKYLLVVSITWARMTPSLVGSSKFGPKR